MFPDWADEVRNRGHSDGVRPDNWQLEALCNIGAAEILMPVGAMVVSADEQITIGQVLEQQRRFHVSTEAILIRMVKLHDGECAMFCASREDEAEHDLIRIY